MITLIPAISFDYELNHLGQLHENWVLRYSSEENRLYAYAPDSTTRSGCVAIFDLEKHGLELRRIG